MGDPEVGRKKKRVEDQNRKPVAIAIKGDPAWRTWVEEGAKHIRMPVSVAIDLALAQFYKAQGYDVPPPERLPNSGERSTAQT